MDEHDITRREILARSALTTAAAVATCAACAAAPAALTGCAAMDKKKAAITTGTVNIGPADQFPAGTANVSLMPTYGIIITNDSGTALAIRPKCTHQGCTVKWNPAIFSSSVPATAASSICSGGLRMGRRKSLFRECRRNGSRMGR